MSILINCPHCEKSFSKMGLVSHIWRKHTQEGIDFCKKHNPVTKHVHKNGAWNNGLNKDTDIRIENMAKNLSLKYQNGELIGSFKGKHHTEQTKKEMSISARNSKHRRLKKKIIKYINKNNEEIILDSSYELILAKDLDKSNIFWKRPEPFKYLDNENNYHHYFPDFYLPEYNIYLDPKNDYLIQTQSEKIDLVKKQNNIKLYILRENELSWNFIKDNILKI